MSDSRRSELADLDVDIELDAEPGGGGTSDGAGAPTPAAYTLFAVFRLSSSHPVVIDGRDVPGAVQELEDVVELVENEGVTLRGWYDVSGMRSDADLMVWLHGSAAEDLQWALRELRRTMLLRPLIRTWSAVGVHREAEFTREHVPGFVRGVPAKQWLTVYPFVRSPEWYLLDAAERRRMLAEHGRAGAAYTGVTANTVAAFALGDYEWLLPMEADELTELVDMMRELRGVDARRYVSVEVPFSTGRLIEPVEIVEVLQ
ncbi:chlorite dismutase family protein [Leucobacter allii]|uniref:Coproheme decarboxylase n=1 Tax=Leucobacter allii TaxID=2932247 RepID=A0ABY4FIR4_9MICO|nr:hydrogen peroxide-dependent heme synthase [Leucobacter allii]UOQ56574.1 chlorite dismutase family protein [Leucobacter allii]UOR01008.1 chlorite dismutase family protein [Leucobacter allii]